MPSAQLASDPSLTVTDLVASDLLVGLRATTSSDGTKVYQPFNIAVSDFASSIVMLGMTQIAANLPGAAPANGGLYLDAGAFCYSAVEGTESGVILTNRAMLASWNAWVASLPTEDPGTGPGNYWSNDGLPTPSVASAS